jgi:hypothetical protein
LVVVIALLPVGRVQDDPSVDDGRLAGERLEPGTQIHLVDDPIARLADECVS